ELAEPGDPHVQEILAPIAPGLVKSVAVSNYSALTDGQTLSIDIIPSVLALDGEREIEVHSGSPVAIRFNRQGPRVVDVSRALQAASRRRLFSVDRSGIMPPA
ncbi:MAG: hypothetical protein SVV67_10800, partial [Bacillota bacterium]|nr:hypothetical protein [Bacillota bacterium]